MNDGSDRLLTLSEVQARLGGVSKSTIFSWIRSRKFDFPKQVKIGRASRWCEAELNAWLSARPRGAYGEELCHE